MKGPVPTDAYWAKLTPREPGPVEQWHPWIDHSLDVALAFHTLAGLDTWRARLSALAGRELSAVDIERLAVIAGLHDIGKLHPDFQAKGHGTTRKGGGHTLPALNLLSRHEEDEDSKLVATVEQRLPWGEAVWSLWWSAIVHHGRPLAQSSVRDTPPGAWDREGVGALRELLDLLQEVFPMAWEGSASLPAGAAFDNAFAGLVMLADWLGSTTSLAPFRRDDQSSRDRANDVQRKLRQHLTVSGLDGAWRTALPTEPSVADLLGTGSTPRGTQRIVQEMDLPSPGSVMLLEAETGSGKTEAALLWWARLASAGLVDGLYFALPLRTAAQQLHRRLSLALNTLLGGHAPPVVQAVPGYLRADDVSGIRMAGFEVLWDDQSQSTARWSAEHPKRYLASAIATGTIDQVLLAALPRKHAHMRGVSVLRSLLIVDEVHASDAYMTGLLQTIVRRQVAAGGQVLLLSATFGSDARHTLLGTPKQGCAGAVACPYPAVWLRQGDGACDPVAAPRDGRTKTVSVALEQIDDLDAIAMLAVTHALAGERVLVIVNRVDRAQLLHQACEAAMGNHRGVLLEVNGIAAPHHSRYARPDRELLDKAVEGAFGKEARQGPALVVATQTVEQSLDLDADRLITDLCPMDVLLQRIGRLHRHKERGKAPCIVLAPSEAHLVKLGTERTGHRPTADPQGLGTVYRSLTALIATRRLIVAARPKSPSPVRATSPWSGSGNVPIRDSAG